MFRPRFFHPGYLFFSLIFLFFTPSLPSARALTPATAVPAGGQGENPAPGLADFADADALNLLIKKHYQVAADASQSLRLQIRRRILSYKGTKDHADFKYSYNRSRENARLLGARTITTDQRIIEVRPEEIHDIPAPWNHEASLYSQSRQLVVSLPAVAPGCEIEIEIELTCANPPLGFWCEESFALFDPIVRKEVIIDCPADKILHYLSPGRVTLAFSREALPSGQVRYRWYGERLAACPREPWAPSAAETGHSLLVADCSSWAEVGNHFQKLFQPALTARIATPTAPEPPLPTRPENPAPTALCRQLYRQLNALTCYDISLLETDFTLQDPARTRLLGYGTNCDLACCLVRELRARKIESRLLLINREHRFFTQDRNLPYPGWWNTALVECEGEFFLFHPARPAPGDSGFDQEWALDPAGGEFVRIKDNKTATTFRELELTLENFPRISGSLQLRLQGAAATPWREQWRDLAPREQEIALRELLHLINPEARAVSPLTISGLEETAADHDLVFRCAINLDQFAAPLPGRPQQNFIYLNPPELPEAYTSLLLDRRQPLALRHNAEFHDCLNLTLPPGLQVTTAPASGSGRLPGLNWVCESRYDPQHRRFTLNRKLELQRGLLSPSDPNYERFLSRLRAFQRPEALRLILSPSGR
ncbi:MAG TPA: DUF3857 domain-containing protein [Proteobacteria bacterium]|nr:DUF3857 domain-containing protein [Pseudomonadota bacterium]